MQIRLSACRSLYPLMALTFSFVIGIADDEITLLIKGPLRSGKLACVSSEEDFLTICNENTSRFPTFCQTIVLRPDQLYHIVFHVILLSVKVWMVLVWRMPDNSPNRQTFFLPNFPAIRY